MKKVVITDQSERRPFNPRRRVIATPQQALDYIEAHNHEPFYRMPQPVRLALKIFRFEFGPREPTDWERWEAAPDALQHRIANNELTVDDLLRWYKGKWK